MCTVSHLRRKSGIITDRLDLTQSVTDCPQRLFIFAAVPRQISCRLERVCMTACRQFTERTVNFLSAALWSVVVWCTQTAEEEDGDDTGKELEKEEEG